MLPQLEWQDHKKHEIFWLESSAWKTTRNIDDKRKWFEYFLNIPWHCQTLYQLLPSVPAHQSIERWNLLTQELSWKNEKVNQWWLHQLFPDLHPWLQQQRDLILLSPWSDHRWRAATEVIKIMKSMFAKIIENLWQWPNIVSDKSDSSLGVLHQCGLIKWPGHDTVTVASVVQCQRVTAQRLENLVGSNPVSSSSVLTLTRKWSYFSYFILTFALPCRRRKTQSSSVNLSISRSLSSQLSLLHLSLLSDLETVDEYSRGLNNIFHHSNEQFATHLMNHPPTLSVSTLVSSEGKYTLTVFSRP